MVSPACRTCLDSGFISELQRTILFVTNNIDEAIYLADRIVTLEGKLPGRMHVVYRVDLPRPREHTDMAFLKLRHEITEASELTL